MKMCQAMVQEGHNVTLYAPANDGIKHFIDANLWHHYGISDRFPILWLDRSSRYKSYDYAWKAVLAAKANGANLVYTRFAPAALLARLVGMKTICEIHTPPTGFIGPFIFFVFLRLTGRRRVIVITHALRRWLDRLLSSSLRGLDVVVAHDGIDLERFDDLPAPASARHVLGLKNLFTVGYAGHLYPGRGIEQMLDLAKSMPEVQFLFIGGEPNAVEARRREVVEKGLENITFIGFVPNTELPQYLAAADALLMPHQRRVADSGGGDIAEYMSPLKMFEYLAMGRLLISSDLPVLREVLSEDVAVLCEPDDIAKWYAAIQRAANNSVWREKKAEHARCLVKEYTWRERIKNCLSGMSEIMATSKLESPNS